MKKPHALLRGSPCPVSSLTWSVRLTDMKIPNIMARRLTANLCNIFIGENLCYVYTNFNLMDDKKITEKDFTVFNARAAISDRALLYTILEYQRDIMAILSNQNPSDVTVKMNKRLQKNMDKSIEYYDKIVPHMNDINPPLKDPLWVQKNPSPPNPDKP
jgi:hypothetical protein